MMEPQEYDCENGCCPKCDCEVCMDVQELSEFIFRYICPNCGYFEDFDDAYVEGDIPMILPPYEA